MTGLSETRLRGVLAWLVIALLLVPVGGALWLGVVQGESPCILCWAERTSMLLIALVSLFVVRYGPRPRYLGVLVLLGAWGTVMALRHSALHLARDVGQGFAGSILGAHTYVWSWVIHWVVLLVAGALLILYRGPLAGNARAEPGRVGRLAMGLLVVLAAANAVQAFISTGPPPYFGQGDPVRLSPDPRHWVWSREEAEGAISWRGAWTIPAPDPAAADPDPAHGPLASLPALPVRSWQRITAPLNGRLTDLALTPTANGGQALAVTDRYGVYVLDSTFARVLHQVVLDPGFSVDLTPLAGAAFLGPDTLAVLSTNKSYVLLSPIAHADPERDWRHFRQTDGTLTELVRARFATVRARQLYALALAFDPADQELITVGVPTPRHRQLVVSRFDRSDLQLASEFLPRIAPGLALAPGRGLADYVVTGAAVADGRLYAVSAAYSTLLVVDLRSRTLTAAYALPGVVHPVGLAVRGPELLVAQADRRIAVLARPLP